MLGLGPNIGDFANVGTRSENVEPRRRKTKTRSEASCHAIKNWLFDAKLRFALSLLFSYVNVEPKRGEAKKENET